MNVLCVELHNNLRYLEFYTKEIFPDVAAMQESSRLANKVAAIIPPSVEQFERILISAEEKTTETAKSIDQPDADEEEGEGAQENATDNADNNDDAAEKTNGDTELAAATANATFVLEFLLAEGFGQAIFDEGHKIKNLNTQIHEMTSYASDKGCYGIDDLCSGGTEGTC
ncbi:MAG: hypothetical protein M1821_006565 [Bathelium mastoideum]|nr:MAG: hypothetical protein M1821_006565 [Bathelium mastoideum]